MERLTIAGRPGPDDDCVIFDGHSFRVARQVVLEASPHVAGHYQAHECTNKVGQTSCRAVFFTPITHNKIVK